MSDRPFFPPEPAWKPRHYIAWAVTVVLLINITQIITAPGIPAMLGF